MPIYNIRGHGKTLPLLDVKVGMLGCSLEFADDLTRRNEEVVLNVSPWTMGAIAKLLQVYSETELATILWEPTRRRGIWDRPMERHHSSGSVCQTSAGSMLKSSPKPQRR
jgi:hypothetical protein